VWYSVSNKEERDELENKPRGGSMKYKQNDVLTDGVDTFRIMAVCGELYATSNCSDNDRFDEWLSETWCDRNGWRIDDPVVNAKSKIKKTAAKLKEQRAELKKLEEEV
jgi:hypothetical protein